MKKIQIITMVLIGLTTALSGLTLSEAQEKLSFIDEQSNFDDVDFSAVMTMINQDSETGIEKNVIQQFRRDSDDKFLMLFQEPSVKKGQGYLMIEDNLWFYDPESRKFSHTSMKDSFGGSHAKNSDFGESVLSEDYIVKTVTEGLLGKYDVYIFDLEATSNEVTYPIQKMWVTKSNYLKLKTEDYSATGRLLRTSLFPSYGKVGDKFMPTKMIFTDELIEGNKTQLSITDLSTRELPDTLFTKAYVERVNR
ncbi:MAG: outer membrane lipoprotein-sorting protein [Spirochaetaceae bacterium]|jgi:outer membrane lipoprotein-sorting protein|nr:outer membrane lipoprotein-sorting protein [Spirochaetaceae bacterium]